MPVIELELARIRLDGGTQVRETMNPATVADYAESIREGANFPPVVVFQDGPNYWLADGFHRVAATKDAGLELIRAEVRPGTLRDALVCALASNSSHGLRLTNADKRKVVGLALDDPELSKWSDREIARWCGVSNPFVSKMRSERLLTVNTLGTDFDERIRLAEWMPKAGVHAHGTIPGDDFPIFIHIAPAPPAPCWNSPEKVEDVWYFVVVVDTKTSLVNFTKKAVHRDLVTHYVEDLFKVPCASVEWKYAPAIDGSDRGESGDYLVKPYRWTWPHFAYGSYADWRLKRFEAQVESA